MIKKPVSVYINWSTYDELSDNVELTEALALLQLDQALRWRGLGAQIDYYLVDAFWYSRAGGLREFRKPHWPDGPDRFFDRCLQNDLKPGLWLPTNNQFPLAQLDVHPAWADSWDAERRSFCLFAGGYLAHLLESMDRWYQRGVRAFKFDFANFHAATPALKRNMLPSEIRAANENALRTGLQAFRSQHPDVVLLGYNGFEEADTFSRTDLPFYRTIHPRWTEVFDSLYCGDPRPSDVPAMNFWRSKDVYSDQMVRYFTAIGFPLRSIDNAGFMIGTTGTCYFRGKAAWQGMLLLSLARGGWVNTYYGNLDLLSDAEVQWFARAQQLFYHFQEFGQYTGFGALPGSGQGGYGFLWEDGQGAVAVVVNPTQKVAQIQLPRASAGRLLFHDAGFTPVLNAGIVALGAEQMALIGFGAYALEQYDFGVMEDVLIPAAITPLDVDWLAQGPKQTECHIRLAQPGTLRVIFQQYRPDGRVFRSTGGAPPDGVALGRILSIQASQAGRPLNVTRHYDKAIWSGLSWAVGEVEIQDSTHDVDIVCATTEAEPVILKAQVYKIVASAN